jgi:dsRNA-specific ribonuclease
MQNTNYKEMLIKHYQYANGHAPTFQEAANKNGLCGVSAIDNKNTIIGTGYGKTKKLAEYECARNILVSLKLV